MPHGAFAVAVADRVHRLQQLAALGLLGGRGRRVLLEERALHRARRSAGRDEVGAGDAEQAHRLTALPDRLEQLLAESPDSELEMAAAVSLGAPFPGEDDTTAARLLGALTRSRSERARFRAAKSIERRARRSDTSQDARRLLSEIVAEAQRSERARVVLSELDKA